METSEVYWEGKYTRGKLKEPKPDEAVVKLIPLLEKKSIKKILDLGCGTGRHMTFLGKLGLTVIGTDISHSALKKAGVRLEQENIQDYKLIKEDMTKIGFPDEYFDMVISTNAIHHNTLNKIEKSINEIWRVLKRNGIVLVIMPSKKDYKCGIGHKLEKDTYLFKKSIHHFFDERGVKQIFHKFKILKMRERIRIRTKDELVHKEILRFLKKKSIENAHWIILAEKF